MAVDIHGDGLFAQLKQVTSIQMNMDTTKDIFLDLYDT